MHQLWNQIRHKRNYLLLQEMRRHPRSQIRLQRASRETGEEQLAKRAAFRLAVQRLHAHRRRQQNRLPKRRRHRTALLPQTWASNWVFCSLYVKNEGENPTGSFKDRGMTVGVSKANELGAKNVICASTGNTSASLAAYAAKAGMQCTVLIPSGKIAYGKLSQAMIYGAKVLQVRGNFDQSLDIVFKIAEKHPSIYLLNSINPFRVEGQKSLGLRNLRPTRRRSTRPSRRARGQRRKHQRHLERLHRIPQTRLHQETAEDDRHPSGRFSAHCADD